MLLHVLFVFAAFYHPFVCFKHFLDTHRYVYKVWLFSNTCVLGLRSDRSRVRSFQVRSFHNKVRSFQNIYSQLVPLRKSQENILTRWKCKEKMSFSMFSWRNKLIYWNASPPSLSVFELNVAVWRYSRKYIFFGNGTLIKLLSVLVNRIAVLSLIYGKLGQL